MIMPMSRRLTSASILLLSLLSASSATAEQVVHTEQIVLKEMQKHDRVTGTLKAVAEASLAMRESGYVTQVKVNEGDRVSKGDLLVQLDDRRLQAELKQLQAELARAKAQVNLRAAELEDAKADVSAYNISITRQAVTERQLRQAKTQAAVARANLQDAKQQALAMEAKQELLQVRLDDTSLYAPFDGIITERHAEKGEWFNQGMSAMQLVNDNQLEAWLSVPERFVALANQNYKQVTLQVNGKPAQAFNVKVTGRVDQRARTFTAIAQIPNEQKQWLTGMSVSAWIPTGANQQQLTVSRDTIVRKNGSPVVYKVVAAEQGKMAMPVPIRILFESGDRVAIQGHGLMDGDTIVNEGNERLMPGPVVAIAEQSDGLHASTKEQTVSNQADL